MLRLFLPLELTLMHESVIFDLDGTLIDSAPSILASFVYAFDAVGMTPAVAISADVVGPPLMATLATLAGHDDAEVLAQLAAQFKAHYDREGYQQSLVYAGVEALLTRLQQAHFNLYIATNKRAEPTQKIMQFLNWAPYFKGVFALDSFTPPLVAKPLMVAQILNDFQIEPKKAIYIGDRYEDGLAADHNQMAFAMVGWGYADPAVTTLKPHWLLCEHVADLEQLLLA